VDLMRIEKQQSPKSICSGYFHYAMSPGEEDEYSQVVEKSFKNIEDWYGENIERIEKLLLSKQKLSDNDKYGLSWIIANFYFRGYSFRKETTRALEKITKSMTPTISENIFNGCKKEYPSIFSGNKKEKEVAQKVVEQEMKTYTSNTAYATNRAFDEGFANTLTHKKWRVLINNSKDYPFITGDEAVITLSNEKIPKSFISNSFLCLTHIFHLSPRIAIIATYPFNEEMHGQVIFEDVVNNPKKILEQNFHYANYTNKYCYAPNKIFFETLVLAKNNNIL